MKYYFSFMAVILFVGVSLATKEEEKALKERVDELYAVLPKVSDVTSDRVRMNLDEFLFAHEWEDFLKKLDTGNETEDEIDEVVEQLRKLAKEVENVEKEEAELTEEGKKVIPQLRQTADALEKFKLKKD